MLLLTRKSPPHPIQRNQSLRFRMRASPKVSAQTASTRSREYQSISVYLAADLPLRFCYRGQEGDIHTIQERDQILNIRSNIVTCGWRKELIVRTQKCETQIYCSTCKATRFETSRCQLTFCLLLCNQKGNQLSLFPTVKPPP